MPSNLSLNDLWRNTVPTDRVFRPEEITNLPDAARRYLEHAIAPGTRLASAVRLKMHGEMRLKRWSPFRAEEVISWNRGAIWRADVRVNGLPVRGSDRLVDGQGAMRWKLLGVFPMLAASNPDISRSAAGRFGAESMWLPSALCGSGVSWVGEDAGHARARFVVQGYEVEINLTIDETGRLKTLELERWGDPGGGAFRNAPFGGIAEAEKSFGGFTIPSRLRVGWYPGTPRFETEGEFFRVTIDDAVYRRSFVP
jgi:hypothetical protein